MSAVQFSLKSPLTYGDAHKGTCASHSINFFSFCCARQVAYADPQ